MASELARAGWRLEAVITDNGSEFRSGHFGEGLDRLGVEQRRIRAGCPTSNGHVERRLTKGRLPNEIIYGDRKLRTAR